MRENASKLEPLSSLLVERELVTYDDILRILGPRPHGQPHPHTLSVADPRKP
jgi:hypothetical protein